MPQEWHDEPLPRAHVKPPARLLLMLAGLVCAVLTTGTAASVYVAGDAVRRDAAKSPRISLMDAAAHRRGATVHALIDSIIAPLGVLPPMDSAMLRDAVALLADRSRSSLWISVDTTRLRSLDTLQFLRAWARHVPQPAFWGYRSGSLQDGWERMPMRKLLPIKRFAHLAEAKADSALLAGDAEGAMTLAREMIAASRHLIDQPLASDLFLGRYLMLRGTRLLVRAAQQGDDPMLAGAARRLAQTSGANYFLTGEETRAVRSLGENPEDGRLLAVAADRALPAAVRVEGSLDAMLKGACRNPREVMFGLSDARREAYDEMLIALGDIPRINELAPLLRAQLELFEAPAVYLNSLKGTPMKESLASLFVPPVLRNRVKLCKLSGA